MSHDVKLNPQQHDLSTWMKMLSYISAQIGLSDVMKSENTKGECCVLRCCVTDVDVYCSWCVCSARASSVAHFSRDGATRAQAAELHVCRATVDRGDSAQRPVSDVTIATVYFFCFL